jgi:hypothetical protein
MLKFRFPSFAENRGPGFWLRPANLISNRTFFRTDNSNEWRYTYGQPDRPDRSKSFSELLDPAKSISTGFRFVILGDTGEGDKSQYSLLPLLNYFKPDFMVIIGDLANPAGRISKENNRDRDDYLAGFFEPYSKFNIPIWSIPGNHEYYSPGQGKEYYDTFCTRKYARRWTEYGLRFVPQPGTYWELKDQNVPFAVIGIDTGKSGKLDGSKSFWKTLPPDHQQYKWLEERLTFADKDGMAVIVLMHIPALRKQKNDSKVHLAKLHKIIASHRCVSHVICGHEHNFELYKSGTFSDFMEKEFKFSHPASDSAVYVINGGGGSGLFSTVFKSKKYSTEKLFPDSDQWRDYANRSMKTISNIGWDRTLIGRLAAIFNKDALADGDIFRYLSFVLVDVQKKKGKNNLEFKVHPVFMEDLRKLFSHPQEEKIDVTDKDLKVNEEYVKDKCIQKEI